MGAQLIMNFLLMQLQFRLDLLRQGGPFGMTPNDVVGGARRLMDHEQKELMRIACLAEMAAVQ